MVALVIKDKVEAMVFQAITEISEDKVDMEEKDLLVTAADFQQLTEDIVVNMGVVAIKNVHLGMRTSFLAINKVNSTNLGLRITVVKNPNLKITALFNSRTQGLAVSKSANKKLSRKILALNTPLRNVDSMTVRKMQRMKNTTLHSTAELTTVSLDSTSSEGMGH